MNPTTERDIHTALGQLNEMASQLAKASEELRLRLEKAIKPSKPENSLTTESTVLKTEAVSPLASDLLKVELSLGGTLSLIESLCDDVQL